MPIEREQVPTTSRITDGDAREASLARYNQMVENAYAYLADLPDREIDASDPAAVLIETFQHALVAEAQVEHIIRNSMGLTIARLVEAGVSLEQIAGVELPDGVANDLAGKAIEIHDLLGIPMGPHMSHEALTAGIKNGTFPILGIEGPIYAITSLETGESTRHTNSIVEFEDAPPHPLDQNTLATAANFLRNPSNAAFTVDLFRASLGAVTSPPARIARDAYHRNFAGMFHPELRSEVRQQFRNLNQVRASFGAPMMDAIADAVNRVSIPTNIENLHIDAFATNTGIGYTKHPQGPKPPRQ